uniref:ZP domain-containing protein n=1 Tax=Ciona savignyi TaxID=51511 RepID=H2YR67_CIOSA
MQWLSLACIVATIFAQGAAQLQCNRIEQCKCSMSDGSGDINLKSVGQTNNIPKWTINAGWWTFRYNPCYAFSSVQFTGLAVHQIDSASFTEEYNLGLQSSESFGYNATDGVSISYLSHDVLRKSRVVLVCEPTQLTHDLLFVGELIITEYEFVLTGPCACPGMCDDNGIVPDSPVNNDSSFSYWNDVGPVIVSLLLHDLIILVVVAIVMLVLKFAFDITCCSRGGAEGQSQGGGFTNPTAKNEFSNA